MAANARETSAAVAEGALEGALLRHGGSFEFHQVVRLLRRIAGPGRRIRLRPALGLDLARGDVARVERDERGYTVETTFLGLYGAASPLPAFYTEELVEAAQEDRNAARELLDVVHGRIYGLYTDALEKYRPLIGTVERAETGFVDLISGLIGLRDPELRRSAPDAARLLPYVGLLGRQQRSAEGLQTLLEDLLPGVAVGIEQCVERSVKVPPRARLRLGQQAHCLGRDALLGTEVKDRAGKLRIHLGPLSAARFATLLRDEAEWAFLVGVIRFYLAAPLECELDIELAPGAGGEGRLGETGCRLGQDAWIGEGADTGLRAGLALE